MKNLITLFFLSLTINSFAQSDGFIYRDDTLWLVRNGQTFQINKNARVWGSFWGNIADQTDLQNVLNAKASTSSIPTNTNQLTNGSGYITSNQTITLSGDATGSGTASIPVTIGTNKIGSAYLTSNFTTSSTTAVNTNLTFTVAANTSYVVDVYGTANKGISATGMKLAFTAPSGATISGVQYGGGALLTTALVPSLITALSTLGTAFATGIGITVPFQAHFTITNGANAGSVTMQAATVTSNTATIFSGTSMTWTKTSPL